MDVLFSTLKAEPEDGPRSPESDSSLAVGVIVNVSVGDGVDVLVGVFVHVGVGVRVGFRVRVAVGVPLGVGVPVGEATSMAGSGVGEGVAVNNSDDPAFALTDAGKLVKSQRLATVKPRDVNRRAPMTLSATSRRLK
jgi:hypothetical protein